MAALPKFAEGFFLQIRVYNSYYIFELKFVVFWILNSFIFVPSDFTAKMTLQGLIVNIRTKISKYFFVNLESKAHPLFVLLKKLKVS